MTSEEETIIAFVFNRSGKTKIDYSKFYLTLSLDLNWFTPEDAKTFTNQAIKHELLIKKDDSVTPNFDITKTDIPTGFYPSKNLFQGKKPDIKIEEKKDVFERIIDKISKESKLEKKVLIENSAQIEKQRNISKEIAALLVGKENNVDLSEFLEDIELKIFEK